MSDPFSEAQDAVISAFLELPLDDRRLIIRTIRRLRMEVANPPAGYLLLIAALQQLSDLYEG